ncbi:hypothetical protein GCM10007108_08650 [Thermogymnomonas acidicola]|uniref:Uncharacterized protein n=1 Tax=Thermogymnomonas acidicola TaxID=399579 RepID=A0AA37BRB6_9ARCH|nr:hypothetical protein GCM10007108_08650 [Thermogymnomonas acidicola]
MPLPISIMPSPPQASVLPAICEAGPFPVEKLTAHDVAIQAYPLFLLEYRSDLPLLGPNKPFVWSSFLPTFNSVSSNDNINISIYYIESWDNQLSNI